MILLLAIATAYLLVCSWQDFRTREVDDKISDSFIILALLIQAVPLLSWNYQPFLQAIIAGLLLFAFGWAMFETGQWGGADVKILTALGILFANAGILFDYFVNIFLVAFAYTIVYSLWLAYKTPKVFRLTAEKTRSDFGELVKGMAALLLSLFAIAAVVYLKWFIGPADIFLLMLPLFSLALVLPAFWLILKFTQVIEKTCFRLPAKAKTLREFDLLTESLVRLGGKILRIPEGAKLKGKVLVNCKDPNGLTPRQIKLIQGLVKARKLKDGFIIKWGLPFVPVFLLALYFTLWYGNGLFALFGLQ